MNLLIDTHAVIWFITEDNQLPTHIKELIEDSANTCLVSIVSLWEMGIILARQTGLESRFEKDL